MDKDIQIIFLDILGRDPLAIETYNYNNKLNDNIITLDDIETELKNTTEYKRRNGLSIYEFTYNPSNDFTATVRNIDDSMVYDGIILTNGKIGIKTSNKYNNFVESYTTTYFEYDKFVKYSNNLLDTFNFCNFSWFSKNENDVVVKNMEQKLNMYHGIFTMSYIVEYDHIQMNVVHDMIALRQYPYCFYQKISLNNHDDSSINMNMYHYMNSTVNLTNIEYINNNVRGDVFFIGSGYNEDRNVWIYVANLYVGDFECNGIEYLNEADCFNPLRLINTGGKKEIEILTCVLTTDDFNNPREEVQRILLSIKDQHIIDKHKELWRDIWKSDIEIDGKTNINAQEQGDVLHVQYTIRFKLYNIFSKIRDDVNVDLNRLNISMFDYDSEIFWNGDLFLIPSLIIIKPKCVKNILEFRYLQLNNALQLANAYGYNGSKYIYKNDIIGYNDIYWNSKSYLYVFNTALVAINTWNYFRISKDRNWLLRKGYKMISSISEFFMDLLDPNGNITDVISLNNINEENNTLSRYLAIYVLKYMIESSYELGYTTDKKVLNTYRVLMKTTVYRRGEEEISKMVMIGNLMRISNNKGNFEFHDNEGSKGYKFGDICDKKMYLIEGDIYEIELEDDVYIKFYDVNGTEVYNREEGTAIYTAYGYTSGTYIMIGGDIVSYKKKDLDYLYGDHAFSTKMETYIVKNVINIFKNYDGEHTGIIEPFIILLNIYSQSLFEENILLEKKSLIQSNLKYYEDRGTDLMINELLKLNLLGTLSQINRTQQLREFNIKEYENLLYKLIGQGSEPWGYIDDKELLILSILTGLGGLYVSGRITNNKYYVDYFGVKMKTSYILPKIWNKLSICNSDMQFEIYNAL